MIDADELDDGIPDDDEGREAWVTDSLVKAGRLMYRAARLAEQRRQTADMVADQIQLAKDWGYARDAYYAMKLAWINAQLEEFALAQREATKDLGRDQVKTLKTMWGEVATREQKAKWEVTDQALAVKAAREANLDRYVTTEVIPEVVVPEQRVETFDVAAAKKDAGLIVTVQGVFDQQGTAIEGISITPATVTATVKPHLERSKST